MVSCQGFGTFSPVGPLVTDEVDPAGGITITTRLNGELRQDGNTRDFIFSIESSALLRLP